MNAEERQSRILALARHQGRVEVTTTAVDLAVAPETIRRDLGVLERRGLLRRTYGGAYPVKGAGFETGLTERETLHVQDKRRIAAEAVKLLSDAETVFVDEGYIPQILVTLLPGDRRLTVVTASLSTAAAVADSPQLTVLLLGGRVRSHTPGHSGLLGLRHEPTGARTVSGLVPDGTSKRTAWRPSQGPMRALRSSSAKRWWPLRHRPSR
ncbi:DeoR/GlpR family DNA-binding transcription regulator [Streptomyces sp. NPDC021354]|uniref:Lactose phosphotransferase system repressor n=1 Tax=Streptomyces lonegramiae TaxID=3075524 RepID=A0ABU2XWW1_9ACTN|nr:DeoR/GlpR family DNA-binding transcription regulator [Streptomyces sp. DSM 41529]MDT0549990.1 DeoR/GlpR family DNA-binding transcription regulator [Streptomyces sp. DSM 41529]